MSNTTITTRSAAEEAALEEVRRLQEEARRLERERLHLAQVRNRIQHLDARAQTVTRRLDEAASRLPDLAMRPMDMPAMPGAALATASTLERYADELTGAVTAYERAAAIAIEQAALNLQRRQDAARLWREVTAMEGRLAHLNAHCALLGRHTGEAVPALRLPVKPEARAELELVQGHHRAVDALLSEWESRRQTLTARQGALAASGREVGGAVKARSAEHALQMAETERRAQARAAMEAHMTAELARYDLNSGDLHTGLAGLLAYAQDQASMGDARDLRPEVSVWLAREAAQRQGVARADALLQTVPEGVNEDEALRRRWAQLAARLQRVLSAMDPMTPSLQREHDQLSADAQRHVNMMLARADWVAVMTRAGCEVLEREDGAGLVVIDLDHPEVFLEAQEYVDDQGTFAVSLELKADPGAAIADENAVTEAVCRKLNQTTGRAAPKVSAQSEVVERKSRITRGRRPAVRRPMAMQRPLSP